MVVNCRCTFLFFPLRWWFDCPYTFFVFPRRTEVYPFPVVSFPVAAAAWNMAVKRLGGFRFADGVEGWCFEAHGEPATLPQAEGNDAALTYILLFVACTYLGRV